ncbi:MAG TPA: hypothetical protein VEH76_05950 [Methylocystis sp.]|nr:hypothetical protein [Methylocystis sp.]
MSFARRAKSASLIAVLVGLGLAPARAADDGSVFNAVGKVFGYDSNKSNEQIDFHERPKLVVPPNRQALPEPREAQDRPTSWPTEPNSATRGGPRVAASNADPADPKRENLTQPPDGYRHASKDLTGWKDPDQKPGIWEKITGFTKGFGWGGE